MGAETVDPKQYRNGQWEPKYPGFAVPQEGPLGERTSTTGAEPWTVAPASSHVLQFRFWDARKYHFLKTLYGGKSLLDVVFKTDAKHGERSYTYFLTDHDYLRRVFDMMAASESPWTVGAKYLVEAKIPYARTV